MIKRFLLLYINITLTMLVGVFFLAGCGYKKNVSSSVLKHDNNEEKQIDFATGSSNVDSLKIRELEAKIVDIPTPLASKIIPEYYNATASCESICLGYSSYMKNMDIKAFYRAEMEWLGWDLKTEIVGYETTLVFEKPAKICIISIRLCSSDPQKNCIILCSSEIKR